MNWSRIINAIRTGGLSERQEVTRQEFIRVNNHGRERTYICADCASPFFNDYQWNAKLAAPVTCEKCGVRVEPI